MLVVRADGSRQPRPGRPSAADLAEKRRKLDDAAVERLRTAEPQKSGNAVLAECLAKIEGLCDSCDGGAGGPTNLAHIPPEYPTPLGEITAIVRRYFTEKPIGVRLHERRPCEACGMQGAAFFRCSKCDGLLCDNCRNMAGAGRLICRKCQLIADGKIDPKYEGDDPGSLTICLGCGEWLTDNMVPFSESKAALVSCCSECLRKDRELVEAVYGKPESEET